MLITERSFISCSFCSYLVRKSNGRKFRPIWAKKRDLTENSRTQLESIFPLRVSNVLIARSAVAVLALGFIDAGGDWSRIGVISRESEDLLKTAAFFVVPLCVFLIFSLSNQEEA
ncbi:uncharacterized protein LOC122646504 isoform X2 [Telopea speciosissima]|uniref:uncharacterized protein LOC122646504 isoform X2 n=1 Tax=Telopea speciosissima TaxID=54955 RepID=UPI001CC3935C|nr:uncharacterized protein LOC122646504 isoform X2 [Telopea speciosissima]